MRRGIRFAAMLALLGSSAAANALAGRADGPPYPLTPQSRALAEQVMVAAGDREHVTSQFAPLEELMVPLFLQAFGPLDATKTAELTAVLRDGMSAAMAKSFDAAIEAYATDLSPQELTDILAFLSGPGGKAEKENLPLLEAALQPALTMEAAQIATSESAAENALAKASPIRRETVARIFKAQDLAAHTRQGIIAQFVAMGHVVDASVDNSAGPKRPAPAQSAVPSPEQARAADTYVRAVMAIETQFYTSHYSDAELAIIAAYLESEAGQAIRSRVPKIQHALGQDLRTRLGAFFSKLDEPVCAVISCTPERRASLKKQEARATTVFAAY